MASGTQTETGLPSRLSYADRTTMEFGKELYVSSIDNQVASAKQMTTVATGFFAIYFALMKFLGIEKVLGTGAPTVNGLLFLLPPVLLVFSVVMFVVTTFPIRKELSLDDLTSIRGARARVLRLRHWTSVAGWTLFCASLLLTVYVALQVLGTP